MEKRWVPEERDGITRARVTHSGLVGEEMRERNNGWLLIVGLLEAWVESQGSGHRAPGDGPLR